MTCINNFNTNSNGNDIEFNGCNDSDLSQHYFDESLQKVSGLWFYNACGQIEPNLDIKIKALKKDLFKFVEQYVNDFVDKTWSKEELYTEVIEFFNGEIVAYSYDMNELNLMYGLDVQFINDIEIIETRGYSQGDYAKVIIDKTQLKKLWGSCPIFNMHAIIHKLFWDCPIHATITINSEEFYYELEQYEWQREEWISQLVKDGNATLEELQAIIPQELPYSH